MQYFDSFEQSGYYGNEYYNNLGLPLAVTVAFNVEFVTAISAACATATDTDFSTNCW